MVDFIRSTVLEPLGIVSQPRPTFRTVYVGNQIPPNIEVRIPEKFIDNTVTSSKYTTWNFAPKNLLEQFRRIANFYFLVVAIIQVVIDSPVSPVTSIAPLVFVITVTAIKQGYEDYLRHKADNEVNTCPTDVLRDGKITEVRSRDIKVGDIVRVNVNHGFPCDMVLLSSHDVDGECTVTTANLDGETNLKTFVCLSETRKMQSVQQLSSLRATIECQQPVTDLYTFNGRMHLSDDSGEGTVLKSLGSEHVLLRGSTLRNTPFVYGCAVYTGQETKMALNSKYKITKSSRVERSMNIYLVVFLIILLAETVLCTILKYTHGKTAVAKMWYIQEEEPVAAKKVAEDFLSFVVLFNYIIPISLYVSVEVQKFCGSKFFEWDSEMYDEESNQPAKANTSDLNEELGQVEYLFTDKTGTLTENDMQFRQCSIGGVKYIEEGGMLCTRAEEHQLHNVPLSTISPDMEEFMLVLVLCHTVRVDHQDMVLNGNTISNGAANGYEYTYHSPSPDEKAFVEACRRYGIIYHGIHDDLHEVTFNGQIRKYSRLHILDFDPTRKRMSVIVKDEKGTIYLLCKGAESTMLPRSITGDHEKTLKHVNEYAMLGLRTIVIGHRVLTETEFRGFDETLHSARNSLENREEKLSAVYEEIEQNLHLLGATAVEDRLQAGVPETIIALRAAGIKVWVLTGDKEETAVNISHAAGHFSSEMVMLRITQQTSEIQCTETLQKFRRRMVEERRTERGIQFSMVIDGCSLSHVLDGNHSNMFLEVCERCSAVLCCRMSPFQKAEIVKMIRNSKHRPVTAAIGDGANDVSMIQEAHVGLGIYGKEGRQAARCSDYSFGKFRFLMRALLVHGQYFYIRIAILVQYFFYKNVAFITAQLYFAFLSSFSSQTVFESFFLLFYNITFTSLPILIYGLFEQNIPQSKLLEKPHLYRKISKNSFLSGRNFIRWNLLGLWHSVVFFFGVFGIFDEKTLNSSGRMLGNWEYGALVITACVFTVNIKLCLETYHWTLLTHIGYGITVVGFWVLLLVYSAVRWPSLFVGDQQYMFGAMADLFSNISVWLTLMLLISVALLPDILLRVYNDIWTRDIKSNCFNQKVYQTNVMSISFWKRSGTLTISTTNILEAT